MGNLGEIPRNTYYILTHTLFCVKLHSGVLYTSKGTIMSRGIRGEKTAKRRALQRERRNDDDEAIEMGMLEHHHHEQQRIEEEETFREGGETQHV